MSDNPTKSRQQLAPELHIMRDATVSRRVNALFREMSHDSLLREQFVTDPSQVVSEYVYAQRLPESKASTLNQLVYAVASNVSLTRWLRDHFRRESGPTQVRNRFFSDFARAVVEHRAEHVVLALSRASLDRKSVV